MNLTNTTRTQIQSLTCLVGKGSGVALNCGVGCRYSSDPTLLWHRLAATAPIWPLGWELPYATDAALKKKKKRKKGEWGDVSCTWIRRRNIVKILFSVKIFYRIRVIAVKSTKSFHRTWQADVKMNIEVPGIWNTQSNSREKNKQKQRTLTTRFQIYHRIALIQTM